LIGVWLWPLSSVLRNRGRRLVDVELIAADRRVASIAVDEDPPDRVVDAAVVASAYEVGARLLAGEQSPVAHGARRIGARLVPAILPPMLEPSRLHLPSTGLRGTGASQPVSGRCAACARVGWRARVGNAPGTRSGRPRVSSSRAARSPHARPCAPRAPAGAAPDSVGTRPVARAAAPRPQPAETCRSARSTRRVAQRGSNRVPCRRYAQL